jgi:hypothetical protein
MLLSSAESGVINAVLSKPLNQTLLKRGSLSNSKLCKKIFYMSLFYVS